MDTPCDSKTSSGHVTDDGSDPQRSEDQVRLKRRISNRECARRLRKRRAEHLQQLEQDADVAREHYRILQSELQVLQELSQTMMSYMRAGAVSGSSTSGLDGATHALLRTASAAPAAGAGKANAPTPPASGPPHSAGMPASTAPSGSAALYNGLAPPTGLDTTSRLSRHASLAGPDATAAAAAAAAAATQNWNAHGDLSRSVQLLSAASNWKEIGNALAGAGGAGDGLKGAHALATGVPGLGVSQAALAAGLLGAQPGHGDLSMLTGLDGVMGLHPGLLAGPLPGLDAPGGAHVAGLPTAD